MDWKYYFQKIVEKLKLFFQFLLYFTTMGVLVIFISLLVEYQVRSESIKFVETFITFLHICLFLLIAIPCGFYVLAFKLFGYRQFKRRAQGIKSMSYMQSAVIILLSSVLAYTIILVGISNELKLNWNTVTVLDFCSLMIRLITLLTIYVLHYLKHFTIEPEYFANELEHLFRRRLSLEEILEESEL